MTALTLNEKERDAVARLAAQLTVVSVLAKDGNPVQAELLCHIGLDPETLLHVTETACSAKPPDPPREFDDGHAHWVNRAYANVIGEIPGEPTAAQTSRFIDAVNSIPDWGMYAAFHREFSGHWPKDPTRLHRPDDEGHPGTDEIAAHTYELVSAATKFLMDEQRVAYIRDGESDLDARFQPTTRELMHQKAQVHVLDDLDRFTEKELLLAFRDDPDALREVCLYRAAELAKQQAGPGKGN